MIHDIRVFLMKKDKEKKKKKRKNKENVQHKYE